MLNISSYLHGVVYSSAQAHFRLQSYEIFSKITMKYAVKHRLSPTALSFRISIQAQKSCYFIVSITWVDRTIFAPAVYNSRGDMLDWERVPYDTHFFDFQYNKYLNK